MQTVRNALLTSICLILLGACGLKGPLYLPPPDTSSNPAFAQEAESATEKSEEEKDSEKKDSSDESDGR